MISLKHLVNRIEHSTELLNQHPEKKELLEKRIERTKEEIIMCVMKNKHNILLERILM